MHATHNKLLQFILPTTFILLTALVVSFFVHNSLASEYSQIGAYQMSSIVLAGDTLNVEPGKYTKYPMLFFGFGEAFFISANDSAWSGGYTRKGDSLMMRFEQPFNNVQSMYAAISPDHQQLSGTTDRGLPVAIRIQKQ